MRGVRFGEFHTGDDWDLILNAKSLIPPTPKTNYIQVEGRDGDLDFSEALTGEVKYNNRTASFSFLLTEGSYSDREALIAEILSEIHGKKLEIAIDDDPDRYLLGRCYITQRTNTKAYGTITVECNCDPWFYNATETIRSFTISSQTNIVLVNNGFKTLSPDITVTGSITLTFGTTSVSLTSGTYKLTDLKLKAGNNLLSATGSGTITFTYREGVL